jgi:hypothetical protein
MSVARKERSEKRMRTRPMELVGLAAGVAVFVAGVVLVSTRAWVNEGGPQLVMIFGGAAFIVALVIFSLLELAAAPKDERPHTPPPAEGDDERGH